MRDQPSPRPSRAVRIALVTVAAVVVLYVLFTLVFPWVEGRMQDPTLGAHDPVATVPAP